MPTYKVSYEIELDAENALEAAKEALNYINDKNGFAHCFHVQEYTYDQPKAPIYLVDLDEPDDSAIAVVANYQPNITA